MDRADDWLRTARHVFGDQLGWAMGDSRWGSIASAAAYRRCTELYSLGARNRQLRPPRAEIGYVDPHGTFRSLHESLLWDAIGWASR